MPLPKVITLTTDFGERDTFVGQMKGRILSICPDARVVDLCHEVPAHDVHAGSFLLETGYAAFPSGTIHVAVVDPGVGTGRRPVAVRTENHVFVAPDNGLLTRVLAREPAERAFVIEASHYTAEAVSATFHGRDVFAPVAAWLARGIDLGNLGPEAGELVRLDLVTVAPLPGETLRLRVLHVDRFGNVTLDLNAERVGPLIERKLVPHVLAPKGEAHGFHRTYAEGEGQGAFLLLNSAAYLEIAVNRGSAANALGLAPGDEVELRVSES